MTWSNRKSKERIRQHEIEPVRIEKKLIHGEMVEVKIYPLCYTPMECMQADLKDKGMVHQLLSHKTSPIFLGEKKMIDSDS